LQENIGIDKKHEVKIIDFKWLKTLDNSNVSWVSRSKTNMQYIVVG